MSIQCEALQNESGSRPSVIPSWLQTNIVSVVAFYAEWAYQRRVKKSRRMLESLPEHILHDIGWPCVDDRLPTSTRISRKK